MQVIIIGTGYVGLVTGACLAEIGVKVICIDIDAKKIANLKDGIIPIYEPGLSELVQKNQNEKRLLFDTELNDYVNKSDAIFIAVGTPSGEDGSADMKYVEDAAKSVGAALDKHNTIIIKSTVPIGSSGRVRNVIQQELDSKGLDITFDMVSNPEFLKEGAAIKDFMSPDRIVIGIDNDRTKSIIDKLYHPFLLNGYRILYMDIASAELTKYAANAMLATRISFMNEMANLCEKVGANITHVRNGIGADPRIGKKFLYAGAGYGGSCFPKDVKAIIRTGDIYDCSLTLLKSVEDVNNQQKMILYKKINNFFNYDLKNKVIAICGLAFKPNTDDMREAPSINLIWNLLNSGVKVNATDPIAIEEAKKIFKDNVNWCKDIYEASENADALVLVTEWNGFRLPDWEKLKNVMNTPVIFDGRNIYDIEMLEQSGFEYFGIGQ